MNGHEFNVESDKIRSLCDPMSIKQTKDLLVLLEYDLQERKENQWSKMWGK